MKNMLLSVVCGILMMPVGIIAKPGDSVLNARAKKVRVTVDGQPFDTAQCTTVADVRAQAEKQLGAPVVIKSQRPGAQLPSDLAASDESRSLTSFQGTLVVRKK